MRKILTASIFILFSCIFAVSQDIICPTISVTGPESVTNPGKKMTFAVNVSGGSFSEIKYKWSVSDGSIVDGQGTPTIDIDTTGLIDKVITATVEIEELPSVCKNSASESGIIVPLCILIMPLDDYGKISQNDEKARLDFVAMEINAQKDVVAHFILYHPLKNGKKSYENRAARIRNYFIKKRGIAPEKVVLISGGDEPEERTRIYIVPAGATPPTP